MWSHINTSYKVTQQAGANAQWSFSWSNDWEQIFEMIWFISPRLLQGKYALADTELSLALINSTDWDEARTSLSWMIFSPNWEKQLKDHVNIWPFVMKCVYKSVFETEVHVKALPPQVSCYHRLVFGKNPWSSRDQKAWFLTSNNLHWPWNTYTSIWQSIEPKRSKHSVNGKSKIHSRSREGITEERATTQKLKSQINLLKFM